MLCILCKGEMQQENINYPVDLKDRFILIKGVPALVCKQCGEQYLNNDVLKKIERIVENAKKHNVEIEIIRYAA